MSKVWRFTGNPENWITAITRSTWALNENNKGLWENQIKEGDVVIFHSTAKSDFINATSSVVGLGYVGDGMYKKDELWWIQEIEDNKNYWPYVVPLKEVYLFSDTSKIDFEKSIENKKEEEIIEDIKNLIKKGVPISVLNDKAKQIDNNLPNFPVNGSASGVNEIYENLIIDQENNFYAPDSNQDTIEIEKRLSENIDNKIGKISLDKIIEDAKSYVDSGDNYSMSYGKKRVRKENQLQKRRVAKICNYTCMVCGYRYEYTKSNGNKGYIIEIDHIKEKSEGGGETLDNLWALCPNCHAKKTAKVIVLDIEKKKIYESGKEIKLNNNNHLGW